MVILYLDAFIIVTCKCLRLAIIWMILFMQRPFIHPYAYSILILLSTTIIATTVFISLLLLLYYCHYYKTVATDKPLRASLLSGAAELTTHLSRLINILWLPCVESINLGLLPSKTVAIPYTCGSSRLFSGAVAGEHSFIYKSIWKWYCYLQFIDYGEI